MVSLGAYTIPRSEYIKELKELVNEPTLVGNWGTGDVEDFNIKIVSPEKLKFVVYDMDSDTYFDD